MKIPRTFELEEGEQALGSWVCGIPSSPDSSIVKHEGTLVLTDRRLVYEPLGMPRGLGTRALLGGGRKSFPIHLVHRAESVTGKQPRLRIVVDGQDPFVVIVSGSRFSVPWSKRKWLALRDAVEAINGRTR